MWRDNQSDGYSSPILFPHSPKSVRVCRQNHHGCRQNIYYGCFEMLSWPHRTSNNIINMCLVARDLYEMFVLYRGKPTSRRLAVGIWREVRVYRAPVHEYIVRRRSTVGQLPDNRRLKCFKSETSQRFAWKCNCLTLYTCIFKFYAVYFWIRDSQRYYKAN